MKDPLKPPNASTTAPEEAALDPSSVSLTLESHHTLWCCNCRSIVLAIMTTAVLLLTLGLSLYFLLFESKDDSSTATPVTTAATIMTTPHSNIFTHPTMAPVFSPPPHSFNTSMQPTTVPPTVPATTIPAMSNMTKLTRAEVLTLYINHITLSNPQDEITANGDTPECLALAWMIANDTTLSLNATMMFVDDDDDSIANAISQTVLGFQIQQRFPLLVMWIYQPYYNNNWTIPREDWLVNSSVTEDWPINASECTWFGIVCEKDVYVVYHDNVDANRTSTAHVGGTHNVVTHIQINGTGSYVGEIPADIGLLRFLRYFAITGTLNFTDYQYDHCLFSTLPESIGRWTALTHFDVYNNALFYNIPDSIAKWTNLQHFDISFNSFTGHLPGGIAQWTALTYFDATAGIFSGTLPKGIDQWTALQHFTISDNAFDGKIPEGVGDWTALTYFNAFTNSLTGTLPDVIGHWTLLSFFNVGSNVLTGTFPEFIGQWAALTYFNAADNYFNGTLPETLGNWSNVTYFGVDGNFYLTGTLPKSIGNWTALTFFSAAFNEFSGTMPDGIQHWSALLYFELERNLLSSTLPNTVGAWRNLTNFSANRNVFIGTLPDSIGQWTALNYFSVMRNSFSGAIPQSIGNWSWIFAAQFEGNSFVGAMPDTICTNLEKNQHYTLSADCTVNCSCCSNDCSLE